MRNRCILCNGLLRDEPLYVLKNMPMMSQNLPTFEMLEFDKTVDLNLCQCSKCGLVQFDCEPVSYYKDSTRAAERSEGLVAQRREEYKYLIESYHLQGKKILEVGAGKGGYLKTLKEMSEYNIQEYGIEYNREYVEIANEQEGVNVFYGDPEISDVDLPEAPYDAFVSFSFLARLIKPNAMVELVNRNLVDGGIGFVMVASLEHILRKDGFFDVTRDHLAYYSIDTLKFLFQKNNFDVIEYGEKLPCYNYVVVKKREALNVKSQWADVEQMINEVRNYTAKNTVCNHKIAVWCAGHFAFTVLSTSGIGEKIEYIIDNAEFKKGHYAPGSKVPIVGPEYFREHPVDIIMILGPIYINEIVKEIREKCSKTVQIVTVDKSGIREIE